jgi:outer membrane receptor protein involved in Fe transport
MYALLRVACVSVMLLLAAGPSGAVAAEVSTQPTPGAIGTVAPTAPTAPAAVPATVPAGSGTVQGLVIDATGAPVGGATVEAKGPTSASVVTTSSGAYSLTLSPGVYTLNASKAGFTGASTVDYPVASGTVVTLNVTLAGETLTSLKEIGRVSVSGSRSGFNTSAASVQTISNQTFADQGSQQVAHVLDETPGVVIDHPGTSANNAAPGAITFPSIRGGLGFETATLIDGHPLAVQTFGDYVTTFLNSYILQGAEIIKGPGAAAPETYYAINGTVNFRTLDPTPTLSGQIDEGTDSYGGLFSNYRISGPIPGVKNNKLAIVLDYAIDGTPGPLKDSPGYTTLPSGAVAPNGQPYGFSDSANSNPININNPFSSTATLVACCQRINQNYNGKTELAKIRYNFSDATTVTVSYLGSQTYTDQNGNHVYGIDTAFQPGAGYTGTLPAGTVPTYQNVFFPMDEYEINNEPIFQGELRTTFHNDTVLARYYTASINRLQYNTLSGSDSPLNLSLLLYGTVSTSCPSGYTSGGGSCTPTGAGTAFPNSFTYNGTPVNVSLPGQYFRETEEDKLHGGSFEYDHYIGETGNVLSFAVNQTNATTDSYEFEPEYVPVVQAGSSERYTTYLLRGIFNPTDKLNVTLSNYFDSYSEHYTNGGPFITNTYGQYDGRLGLTYRAARGLSLRASTGSSLAPPYLALLDSSPVTSYKVDTSGTFATATHNVGNVKAETSFGYDIGADYRLPGDGQTILSTDLYLNNVKNQFVSGELLPQGATPLCVSGTTGHPVPAGGCATGTTLESLPTFFSSGANVDNARYEGIELAVNRDPLTGFGFDVSGALIRAYPYNVSPCIYSNVFTGGVQNCTKATTNLGIISGANFNGSGSSGSNGSFANGAGSAFNAVSNHSIPYSQGYGSIHYRAPFGGLVEFGETYFGPNNSYEQPAFLVADGSVRIPLGKNGYSFQVSGYNLFDVYGGDVVTLAGGVGVPLYNGQTGLTNGNVVGPRTVNLTLEKKFGGK